MSDAKVELTLAQYTQMTNDIAVIKDTLPKFGQSLEEHMETEEVERKKIYRALIVLGGLLVAQIVGVPLDLSTIISLFT